MKNADWYGVKLPINASSKETAEIIEWCKKNNIIFTTITLQGLEHIHDQTTDYYLRSPKEIEATNGIINVAGRSWNINVDKHLRVIGKEIFKTNPNLGMGFFFNNKSDAARFKLTWGNQFGKVY